MFFKFRSFVYMLSETLNLCIEVMLCLSRLCAAPKSSICPSYDLRVVYFFLHAFSKSTFRSLRLQPYVVHVASVSNQGIDTSFVAAFFLADHHHLLSIIQKGRTQTYVLWFCATKNGTPVTSMACVWWHLKTKHTFLWLHPPTTKIALRIDFGSDV
jgi:hypothetical protein